MQTCHTVYETHYTTNYENQCSVSYTTECSTVAKLYLFYSSFTDFTFKLKGHSYFIFGWQNYTYTKRDLCHSKFWEHMWWRLLHKVTENVCSTTTKQECSTEYHEQCSSIPEEKCENKYESVCQTDYEDHCETTYDQQCETTYSDECHTTQEQQCSQHYDQVCTTAYRQELKQECTTNYHEECLPSYGADPGYGSPTKDCKQVPVQSCVNNPVDVPYEKCEQVPKTECVSVPKQHCKKVPSQQCTQVPKQSCTKVPKQSCHQVKINFIRVVFPQNCFCHDLCSCRCRSQCALQSTHRSAHRYVPPRWPKAYACHNMKTCLYTFDLGARPQMPSCTNHRVSETAQTGKGSFDKNTQPWFNPLFFQCHQIPKKSCAQVAVKVNIQNTSHTLTSQLTIDLPGACNRPSSSVRSGW